MRIILVEFTWQAEEIVNNKQYYKNDVVVSLHPESSYIFKFNKISYFENYEFCKHSELWPKYKNITERSIKITKVLDEALHNIDKRFKDLNWNFFDDYHYPLKIAFDQMFYYAELISKLIEKFNPTEIIVADTGKILIGTNFLVSTKISVIKYLLKTYENTGSKIKIGFVFPKKEKFTNHFSNNLKRFMLSLKISVKKKLINTYYNLSFFTNYYTSKPKYLAVGSFEVIKYKKMYPKESKFFLNYNDVVSSEKNLPNDLIFFKEFIDYLKNKTNFSELIKHKNFSFELIFNEILLKLTKQLNFILYKYNRAKKLVKKISPNCVIFQTMSPTLTNVVFRKTCIDLLIPFVTWSHGGYGMTYSLPGSDVTDFRLCKNHISYGIHLRDLLENNKCILKELKFHENQKIFPVGSVKLDYDNTKQKSKNKFYKNNKKTVLFSMGSFVDRNHFYFGRNREKYETSLWELHYEILRLLTKYQDKYNIIIKDYPNGHKSLWKRILQDIGAKKISFFSNEYKINDLLRISDLNIFPWVSTTFYEALYFKADIFVIEEDIFFKDLEKEIFYFKDKTKFLEEIENYLKIGKFYNFEKNNAQNYFLKLDHLYKRDKLLNNFLNQIS